MYVDASIIERPDSEYIDAAAAECRITLYVESIVTHLAPTVECKDLDLNWI